MQPGDMHYQQMNEDGTSARGYQDFSPSIDNQGLTRKRTLSMSEGLPNAFMQPPFIQGTRPTSVGGWPVQGPTKDAAHAADLAALDEYDTVQNGSTRVMPPFWAQELPESAKQPAINPEKLESLPAPMEVDEEVLNAYVYVVFPAQNYKCNQSLTLLALVTIGIFTLFSRFYRTLGIFFPSTLNQPLARFKKLSCTLYSL